MNAVNAAAGKAIDELMERASSALVTTNDGPAIGAPSVRTKPIAPPSRSTAFWVRVDAHTT